MTGAQLPHVSVIVPVRDDVEGLARCLATLQAQAYPPDRFEVVVVDNASTRDLRPALPDDARFRMVHEARPGSYVARNAGVAVATGEVLAFTDADCRPRPDWLSQGVAALGQPDVDAVGGAINLLFRAGEAPTTGPELYESQHEFRQRAYVEELSFAATANLFVGAGTFARVGAFDAELRSGGDMEWGQRLSAAGGRLVYGAQAVVDHPARSDWGSLARKTRRVAHGIADHLEPDGRSALVHRARREARRGLRVWLRGWGEAPGPAMARLRYVTAVTRVQAIRVAVQLGRAYRYGTR